MFSAFSVRLPAQHRLAARAPSSEPGFSQLSARITRILNGNERRQH
jgi:hypothetical protein